MIRTQPLYLLIMPLIVLVLCNTESAIGEDPIRWGNATYVNLAKGEIYSFMGKTLTLKSVQNAYCSVDVEGETASLIVARRALPTVVNGIRVLIAAIEM